MRNGSRKKKLAGDLRIKEGRKELGLNRGFKSAGRGHKIMICNTNAT